MNYETQYCDRCIHRDDPCVVWAVHMLRNYDECNNQDSILHMLIPRTESGNEQCRMFIPKVEATK